MTPTQPTEHLLVDARDMLCDVHIRSGLHGEDQWGTRRDKLVAAINARLSALASRRVTEAKKCPRCKGTGKIEVVRHYHGDRDETWEETCNVCNGSGLAQLPRASPAAVDAVLAEREACAQIAESYPPLQGSLVTGTSGYSGERIAAAIRARSALPPEQVKP